MHSHRNDLAGRFVMHAECCAQVEGNRHTVTLHGCGPDDLLFVSLVPLNRRKPAKTRKGLKTSSSGDVAHCPSCAKGSGISEVNISLK
jgi:hypothetical protein